MTVNSAQIALCIDSRQAENPVVFGPPKKQKNLPMLDGEGRIRLKPNDHEEIRIHGLSYTIQPAT
jgi:hypothetical protein